MITLKNNEKYAALFKKAWDELYYRGKFDSELNAGEPAVELKYYQEQENTFNTLEDYFTRIKDLIDVKENEKYPATIRTCGDDNKIKIVDNPKADKYVKINYEFIMLPLDEPHFEINANTRDITIPPEFKKLVGVQGDHVAETLIFTIDRYFDFVDLYRDDMKIYAQWTDDANNDKATELVMKFYDPTTKKIVFGWSLHELITKTARNINFSIRFLSEDKAAGIDPATNKIPLKYSLNTKIHTITIVPALQSEFNKVDVERASDYFLTAIANSTSADASATIPQFSAPGLDLDTNITDFEDLPEDNGYYILTVQAVAPDQGVMAYENWNYVNLDGNREAFDGEKVFKPTSYSAEKANWTKYYIQTQDAQGRNTYTPASNPESAEDGTLYECYWTCNLDKEVAKAGSYSTSVRHRNGNALSKEVLTNTLTLPGPGEVSFGQCEQEVKDRVIESEGAIVTIDTNINRNNAKVNIIGTWEYSGDGQIFASMTDEQGTSMFDNNATTLNLIAKAPGWYKPSIYGIRNNVSTDTVVMADSYKITNLPPVPNVNVPAVDTTFSLAAGVTTTLSVEFNDIDVTDALQSDEIIYEWYGQIVDSLNDFELINENTRSVYCIAENTAIDKPELRVKGAADKSVSYYCKVINKLNERTAEAISKVFIVL